MAKTGANVSLAAALKRTRTKPKMWRDLVEAKLVEPAVRSKHGKGYEISAAQYTRLRRISSTRPKLDGRFTIGKLAYALAKDWDRSVPVTLVRAELGRRVDKFFGFARRTIQRHFGLSPKIGQATEREIYATAKKFANRVTKQIPIAKRVVAFPACYLFIAMFLKMLYVKGTNPLGEARGIKELLILTGSLDHPDKGHVGFSFGKALELATKIVSMFSGLWRILTIDRTANILYSSTQTVNDDEFWKAFSAGELVGRSLWEVYRELGRHIKLPSFSAKERAKIDPLFVATIVAFQANPPIDPGLLNELLSGSDQKLRSVTAQLLDAVRAFLKLQPLLEPFRNK